MRQIIIAFVLISISTVAFSQAKKRDKVKRKYQKIETTSPDLIPVYIHGEIYDEEETPLAGASVSIDGTKKGVNSNENGEFLIENLQTGKARLRVSYIGFKTKTIDYELRPGENYYKIMLVKDIIHIEPIAVNAQKREQQLLNVPTAVSAVSALTMQQSNITELSLLSEFVPGLYIREQGANRPGFVIRGLTSDEVSPSAQPRVSVYYNNVPVNRANGASVALFDMEQVEVFKGPQNTLFGRGAQAGAVHFLTAKPGNKFNGYVTAGLGNYGQKEARAAINLPLIKEKLFVRAAGLYDYRNGYVENTFGGTLNGKNTTAGRFSARFLPAWNHKFDLVVNYQKDETPGIAFMSKKFANTNGVIDVFSGVASLEQGENLGTGKDIFDAALNYRYYIDEHNYWTSITSYRKINSSARWDGDGTAAPAIDMAENAGAKQFYQEIRGNFTYNSRLNGSLGVSYWWEKANQTYWFSPNEQSFIHLFSPDNSNLVDGNGQPVFIPAIPIYMPELDSFFYQPLPTNHEEEKYNHAFNQSIEAFVDGTYQLTRKIYVSAGIRGVFDRYKLTDEAAFTAGSESILGGFIGDDGGNLPNLFFKPGSLKEISKNTPSFTGRAGLEYRLNDYTNIFTNYSRGRRPNVLQFTSTGEEQILDAEILNNYDAGFKTIINSRYFIDVVGFYQKYKNFQTNAWIADTETGEFDYLVQNSGKATSYGGEATIKAAIIKQLELFGNYAYLHATFDSTDVDGLTQEYAGNTLRLSPEHSFTAGLNAHVNITSGILIFVSPSYSFKTHMYFEDANTEGLEQDAYGLLNINGGVQLSDPNLVLSVHATNILDEQYVTSAGNTGSLFGVPTFVPGTPRMFGAKITWNFTTKEKPYYKRGRLNR